MKFLNSALDIHEFINELPDVRAAKVQLIWNRMALQNLPKDRDDGDLVEAVIRSRNNYSNILAYYRGLDWPELPELPDPPSTLLQTQRSILAARCAVDWNGAIADLFPLELRYKHRWTESLHELDRLCHFALLRRVLPVGEVQALRSGEISPWN